MSFSAALPTVERSACELEAPAAHAGDHLDLRCHARQVYVRGRAGRAGVLTLFRERYRRVCAAGASVAPAIGSAP